MADAACSASRAYLAYMRAAGYRAKKVLLVEFRPLVPRPQPAGRLQRALGIGLGGAVQRLLGRGAPRAVSSPRDPLFEHCCDEMQGSQDLRIDYFGAFDFGSYAEELERCVTLGYSDTAFQATLRRQPGALLYTCGDRVPAALTEDPRLRILHIHPGVVPAMRGSDGLLWSLAVRGKPGASCFYMDAGLDTGALIGTREFERPRFPGLARFLDKQEPTLYRALLYAYDPHLRGTTLVEVLRASGGRSLRELPCTPQRPDEGRLWFAMHPRLRRKVFAERILC